MNKYLVIRTYNQIDSSIRWVSIKLNQELIDTLRECRSAIQSHTRLGCVETVIGNEIAYLNLSVSHFNFDTGWGILTQEEVLTDNTDYTYEYHRVRVDSWGDMYFYSDFKHSNEELHSIGINPTEIIDIWEKETNHG